MSFRRIVTKSGRCTSGDEQAIIWSLHQPLKSSLQYKNMLALAYLCWSLWLEFTWYAHKLNLCVCWEECMLMRDVTNTILVGGFIVYLAGFTGTHTHRFQHVISTSENCTLINIIPLHCTYTASLSNQPG